MTATELLETIQDILHTFDETLLTPEQRRVITAVLISSGVVSEA